MTRTKGHRTVDRAGYSEYIQSDAWKAKRRQYFARTKEPRCYVCEKSGVPLDLHHKTYKNLGNERMMDLVPVCRNCHELIHRMYAERTNRNDGIWQITNKARTAVCGPRSRRKRMRRKAQQAKAAEQAARNLARNS